MTKQNLMLGDCMDLMRSKPDKFYDLAIVDPPYGIGESGGKCRTRKKHNNKVIHVKKDWDNKIPSSEYFDELFRVSKNQIIWGANYFTKFLPKSMGWIYWDKLIGGDFSDGELAFTSFERALKKFTKSVERSRGANDPQRIHPTQKPIALYKWLLTNYAKSGQTILDTHGGSFSHAIAAYDLDFDLDIVELDPDYYRDGKARFDAHVTKCEEIKSLGYAKSEITKINPILF